MPVSLRRTRSWLLLAGVVSVVGACGGGSGDGNTAPATSQSPTTSQSPAAATGTGSVMLSWMPPTQNTDGSPLMDLAGYKVYWGTTQGSYQNSVTLNNPGLASYVVDQLTPATWYFAMSSLNRQGAESALSNTASKVVQ